MPGIHALGDSFLMVFLMMRLVGLMMMMVVWMMMRVRMSVFLPRVYSLEDLEESRVDSSSPDSTGFHKSNQSQPKAFFLHFLIFFLEKSSDMHNI